MHSWIPQDYGNQKMIFGRLQPPEQFKDSRLWHVPLPSYEKGHFAYSGPSDPGEDFRCGTHSVTYGAALKERGL